jgi:IS5 family transposase
MRRELGQLSLADGLVEGAGRPGAGEDHAAGRLGGVRAAAWRDLRRAGRAAVIRAAGPAQVPVLQQWYRLSEPGLEEALSKRLSFRRFVGPARADPVPDHSTLSRFRPLDVFA